MPKVQLITPVLIQHLARKWQDGKDAVRIHIKSDFKVLTN